MLEEAECDGVLEKSDPRCLAHSLYADQGSGRAAKQIHVVNHAITLSTRSFLVELKFVFLWKKSIFS